jgi:hypothetical protein
MSSKSKPARDADPADVSEAPMTGKERLEDAAAHLNELLESGEISPEAYAEYTAAADTALLSSTDSSPHTRQAAMFDHVTLRVADLAIAGAAFMAVLDTLEDGAFMEPSGREPSTPSLPCAAKRLP